MDIKTEELFIPDLLKDKKEQIKQEPKPQKKEKQPETKQASSRSFIKDNVFSPIKNISFARPSTPVCPRCGKPMQKALSISGESSACWLECPECHTLVNTYKPLPHQAEFLRRPETYKMTAGGYGSGKSYVDIQDVTKHVLLIPSARVCVAAKTYPSLETTFIKDFYAVFPNRLIRSKNDQKHEIYLTNGSAIFFRSFDDP